MQQGDDASGWIEVETVAAAALGNILQEPDPTVRYARLTRRLDVYEQVVARIADERARCATDLHAGHLSFSAVAGRLPLGSRSRAQQLITRGRELPGVIVAFRDQVGEIYDPDELWGSGIHCVEALLQFEPADRGLRFAGQLLRVYIGDVDEQVVTPSLYTYTTVAGDVGSRRVRPSVRVHELLFGTRRPDGAGDSELVD